MRRSNEMKGMKNIIIGVVVVAVVVFGIVNMVDMKAAVFKVQKSIEEKWAEDTVDEADIFLERELEKLRSLTDSYEGQLREKKIDVVLQQKKLDTQQQQLARYQAVKEDFAALVRESLAAGNDEIVIYGRVYTPESARNQLASYIVEEQAIADEVRTEAALLQDLELAVADFEQSVRDMNQEYAALERHSVERLAQRDVSEVEKITSDVRNIINGTAEGSELSRTTEKIHTILAGLEERTITTSAEIAYSGTQSSSAGGEGAAELMTFEETERARRAAERKNAVEAEVQALLGFPSDAEERDDADND
jgi:hypothetical protein